jgi:RNA recognition motif-containing protein
MQAPRFKHSSQNELHVCLFAGNLSVRYNRENLHKLFSEIGSVIKVEVRHRTKDYKTISGFGFVTLESMEMAVEAINKLNGHFQFGRKIK